MHQDRASPSASDFHRRLDQVSQGFPKWELVLPEQCQVVVFVADDLGLLGPGIPDIVTELCPPQDTA